MKYIYFVYIFWYNHYVVVPLRRPPPPTLGPPQWGPLVPTILVLRTKSKGCPPNGPHPLHSLLPPFVNFVNILPRSFDIGQS